jgi:hypothetical protein
MIFATMVGQLGDGVFDSKSAQIFIKSSTGRGAYLKRNKI